MYAGSYLVWCGVRARCRLHPSQGITNYINLPTELELELESGVTRSSLYLRGVLFHMHQTHYFRSAQLCSDGKGE